MTYALALVAYQIQTAGTVEIAILSSMVVTLTGDNSFALKRELKMLTDGFLKHHGDLSIERLDGQEASHDRITETLTALPFLASRKLVVLREPSSNKQFTETAEQLLDGVPETNDVVLVEPKLDKRLSYYKFLKQKTDFRELADLDPVGLTNWLAKAAKSVGGSLSNADARYLVERLGTDQQLLANELDKLLLFEQKINRQTIDLLTEPAPQSTVFELLAAGFAGDHRNVLRLYAEQRALKVEPPQIIAMLSWQLHVLATLKTAGDRNLDTIAKEAKINPFVLRKSQSIARQLSATKLKSLVSELVEIDVHSKSESIDIDEALQHYLLTLAD